MTVGRRVRGEQRTRGSFAVGCAFYFLNLLIVMRGGLGVCVCAV